MKKPARSLILAILCVASLSFAQQQVNDSGFHTQVDHPTFASKRPRVGIDEGHKNFHMRDGRYKPFAELMESDGFAVSAAPAFDARALKGVDILVVANAMGDVRDPAPGSAMASMTPAFTQKECDAVRDWVRGGGSLMLISDHVPWGDGSLIMAKEFGVEMGRGIVMDAKNSDNNPTRLVFSRENGLLGNHAILRGRNASEQVRKIIAFTGQSLTIPASATVLMKLSDDATESFDPQDQLKVEAGIPAGQKIIGRAQGLAMPFGKGRVTVFGEAAMFSAQVATVNGQSFKMGMNVPGNDDRQFALNVMHWLAHVLN